MKALALVSLIGMYFIPSSENYDETKAQKYQKLYKGALYSWLFMVQRRHRQPQHFAADGDQSGGGG